MADREERLLAVALEASAEWTRTYKLTAYDLMMMHAFMVGTAVASCVGVDGDDAKEAAAINKAYLSGRNMAWDKMRAHQGSVE